MWSRFEKGRGQGVNNGKKKKEGWRVRERGDWPCFGRGKGRDVARELFMDVPERSGQFCRWQDGEGES